MKRNNYWFSGLTIFMFVLLSINPRAYAEDGSKFNDQIKAAQTHRALIEAQLGIIPRVESYDLADHFAQDQLVRTVMEDEGIC